MAEFVELGADPAGTLSIEDVARVAREGAEVRIGDAARARIARGRERLEELVARGERIYGVNTGVGGNVGLSVPPEQMDLLAAQPAAAPLLRHRAASAARRGAGGHAAARGHLRNGRIGGAAGSGGCAGGAAEPRGDAGGSAVRIGGRERRSDALGVHRARAGGGGRGGIPGPAPGGGGSARGRRVALPSGFAPKEGLALINGTTVMTAVASLLWIDAFRVLRALLGAVALSVEAMQSPDLPFEPWVHQQKGHPGQIAVAAYLRGMLEGSAYTQPSGGQSCYSLRCAPQGLGQAWEALEDGRAVVEREINSANDNPLIDPETGRMYKAGNFYGGHIARLLDTWKIDFASMANWGNALVAVLVDDRFNQGLPANLTPEPGLNSGFKGMQLSVTSLACAVRQMAGPSSIHSLPTEQYNQDVVSLGMHAAVTAMDALECLRNETAMVLLAAAQAVDLRGGPAKLGSGSRRVHAAVRQLARFQDRDRPMEHEVAAVSAMIAAGQV